MNRVADGRKRRVCASLHAEHVHRLAGVDSGCECSTRGTARPWPLHEPASGRAEVVPYPPSSLASLFVLRFKHDFLCTRGNLFNL